MLNVNFEAMNIREEIEKLLAEDYGCFDDKTVDKLLNLHSVSEPLDIFMTYDRLDGEVFAAFTSKNRCELESEECQTPMQQTKLYFGERK